MSKRPESQTTRYARDFIEKFGYRKITVTEFDLFIIDNKMAKDPGTEETTDPRWLMFINERSQARAKLNRGGPWIDQTFLIEIVEAGRVYRVVEYGKGTVNIAEDIGERVRLFAHNRRRGMEGHRESLKQLHLENPDDSDVAEAQAMLAYMSQETLMLEGRINSLVTQYNNGMDAAIGLAKEASDRYMPASGLVLVGNDSED